MGSSVAAGQPSSVTQPSELSKMWLSSAQWNSLVYWDNPRDSGIVCGSVLVCLLAVRYISLISVIGNLSLALVTATMSFRIYKSVLTAVNKTQDGHPFKQFLDVDVTLPAEKISSLTDGFFPKLNNLLLKLKSILLVQCCRNFEVRCCHVSPDLSWRHHERSHRYYSGLDGSLLHPPDLQRQPETDRRGHSAPEGQTG